MIKFGTGGWRAIIGDEFTKSNIQILAAAVSKRMKSENVVDKGIVVGYDNRFLSDVGAQWFSMTLASFGVPVYFIDRSVPTPLIMFTVNKLGCYYGAAITASHNPALYNGIKLFTYGGRDAVEQVTKEIEDITAGIEQKSIETKDFKSYIQSGQIKKINPTNDYIDSIISAVDIDIIKKRSPNILLDPMYGVSKTCLQTILLTARCNVDVINDRHDTLFGGKLPSPSAKTLVRLRQLVLENGYDMGIATDGDADRIGIIDSNGVFIHPNDILVMLYYYLVKYKGWKGPVVRNVATTHLLDKIADSFGEKCYEVPVGFKWISSKMEQTNAVVGGESSGGLTVRGHIKGKDGVYAAALLVEMMCVIGTSLSDILSQIKDEFGPHEMAELSAEFDKNRKGEIYRILMVDKQLPDFGMEIEKVSYNDGCKVYFKNGGFIISRFSGTEPLLRIFCELDSMQHAEDTIKIMSDFLKL